MEKDLKALREYLLLPLTILKLTILWRISHLKT